VCGWKGCHTLSSYVTEGVGCTVHKSLLLAGLRGYGYTAHVVGLLGVWGLPGLPAIFRVLGDGILFIYSTKTLKTNARSPDSSQLLPNVLGVYARSLGHSSLVFSAWGIPITHPRFEICEHHHEYIIAWIEMNTEGPTVTILLLGDSECGKSTFLAYVTAFRTAS